MSSLSLGHAGNAEAILRGRNLALQQLATGRSLEAVLTTLTASVEEIFPEVRSSVLLLDERNRLRSCAAPSLAPSFVNAIDDGEIGPEVGSCGAAAFHRRRVIVEDVMAHPNWCDFRHLAVEHGFRACWSEPIFSSEGEVLGTFAMYYESPRGPGAAELEFLQGTAHLAGIAIERKRDEQLLVDSEERFRQLAENIRGAFWLMNWESQELLYVSPAYEAIYELTCQSLHDNPRSWSDRIHEDDRTRVVAEYARDGELGLYDTEYRIVRPDGSVRWIHDRAFPIKRSSGAVYRMAGISEDVTDRVLLDQELWKARDELDAHRKEQLESLTSELLLAEERERQRLAQDLHDGLSQTMSLAQMKLGQARERAAPEEREALAEVAELIGAANRTARSLTFQLSPPVLRDLGFEAAVQWLVDDIQESYELEIQLDEGDGPLPLEEKVGVLLFRAVRELLINVAKHARARRATVVLSREGNMGRIAVQDDGVAFDTAVIGRRGIGLYSIRQRLSHLGGRMTIESEPGEGTTVHLHAPLAQGAR